MNPLASLDAIVIGSGPNGLGAAIALAQAGHSVRVFEAEPSIGGGTRSAELTLPGFTHDVCSAVHALALASPFLKTLPLAEHGLHFAQPEAPFAHPLDDGTAVVVERSVDTTAESLGVDAKSYKSLIAPLVRQSDRLMEAILGPAGFRHPFLMAAFGLSAIRSASGLARSTFASERTRAMWAGVAAHSMLPLTNLATSGYALGLIVTAHSVGWPVAQGGSQKVADALAAYLGSLGGEIIPNTRIESLDHLPDSRAVLCDITPRQLFKIAGSKLPENYKKRLEKYRYGPGVFKMDWALNSPVPWRAAECNRAGTIHIGGSFAEIAASEQAAWDGKPCDRPYVLCVQPSRFDPSRAPAGKHTLWAYCHVPHASKQDMTDIIEAQIERFAPGFRDCIAARSALFPADLERHNANLIGGDIGGGAADLAQFFTRPVARLDPYSTPAPGLYLCSSSTPPGVGVHGMCGYWAAKSAQKHSLSR
jgi:phytoene dehydrogenase-like protein